MTPWPPPLPPWALRAGYLALTAPRSLRFIAALHRPRAAQRAVLRRVVALAAPSAYGRHHGLDAGDDYEAFSRKIPVVGYEDLRPWIDRQIATGEAVLSREAPLMYERTSGSSGRPKLVPYTPTLMASFNACFVLWVADLMAFGPAFRTGRVFFSVSPAFQEPEQTPSGVPISLADDTAYLSERMQRLFMRCFFTPPTLKQILDAPSYRRALAAVLVAEARLETISVWSPTYLLTVFETIRAEAAAICEDLRRGETGDDEHRIPLPPVSAERLEMIASGAPDWRALWPHLRFVSCWTDAASATFAPAIRRELPGILIQGKGLLATEAPITVPLMNAAAPVPLLDEVFLEFEREDGSVHRLHELRPGEEVKVLVTQGGGLLRYRMNDRVRVEAPVGRTPTLRFLGRDGRSSDLVGEKLGEPFVRAVLAELLGDEGHCSYLVAEAGSSDLPGYVCVSDHPLASEAPDALAARLDAALGASYHYGQARGLGQLRAARVVGRSDAAGEYERAHLARGMSWGQIKFEALIGPPAATTPGAGGRV
jgi:hypothetical protein